MSGLVGAVFIFCSFWIYNYIDLEDDLEDFAEREHQGILGENTGRYETAEEDSDNRYY